MPKKGITGLKQEKLIPPLNSAYSNYQPKYQVLAKTGIFEYWDQISPKKDISGEKRKKVNITLNFVYWNWSRY